MLKNPDITMLKPNRPISGRFSKTLVFPAVNKGSVSVNASLRHYSVLLYTVPGEVAKQLIPDEFELEHSIVGGKKVAWLSVVSFLDDGSRNDGQGVFEQTEYRIHVMRDGQPAQWLIGTSLGSLAAVGMRNLWPMPWHLSAMEFQVSYDSTKGRYTNYHLQTQSQWENAIWEIADSGEAFMDANQYAEILPSSLFAETVTTFFERRDGSTGSFETRNSGSTFTKASLKRGQSEMLTRLGLLSSQSTGKPILALTQKTMNCQHYSPTILGGSSKPDLKEVSQTYHFAYAS